MQSITYLTFPNILQIMNQDPPLGTSIHQSKFSILKLCVVLIGMYTGHLVQFGFSHFGILFTTFILLNFEITATVRMSTALHCQTVHHGI
jgi:hypothetical protein